MKKVFIYKVRDLALVMLLVLAVSVVPVMACPSGVTCGSASDNATASKPVIKKD